MPIISNQYLQGINQTTGTGAPTHSAVAGDRYTDTVTGNTYQYTTSWQQVPYSAGGLTYFTEAQNTTAPNATVNVDSLTAIASTTNADIAIVPKGTGAILGSIPDGTNTGGNKRGANAVDLQTLRAGVTQVASGIRSVISGGYNNISNNDSSTVIGGYLNTSSGAYSVSGGYQNTASGQSSVAMGASNNALANSSIAMGTNNYVSNNFSCSFGQNNTVTEQWSFASGIRITCGGRYSNVQGYYGNDFGVWGRQIFSVYNSVSGDCQKSTIIFTKTTTGTTPSILSVQDSGVNATSQLVLQNNNSIRFKGTIIAKQSGSTNTAAWDIDGFIQRGASASTTTLLISNINVVQNTPAWATPTLTTNTSLGCLTITVTGVSSTNIQWNCIIDTTEVIYA